MKLNKILRWVALGGIFLVPFVPLVIANNLFFPFITGKAFVFRILVMIAAGAWLILALRDEDYRPKNSWILKALVVFFVIVSLADIFGANPFKSFWSNFERMEGWVGIFHLFLYFLTASSMLNDWKLWKKFFQTSIVASVIMSGYGILQLTGAMTIFQGGTRLDGTFGNATYLAVYMLFHIFLTFFLLLRERFSKTLQWTYGIIIALQLFTLYHTATRGVSLGLLGGILVTAILIALFEKERLFLKKGARIALISIVILVGGFIAIKNTSFVQNSGSLSRLASISLNEAAPRFMVWNMGWQGFLERPILGWGQESFNFVFNKYYDPKMYTQEQWFDRSHNIIFDWLIAAGILGLLSYLSIFVALLFYLWRGKSEEFSFSEKAIFTGLLAAYFFQNIFVFDNIGSYIMFFSILAFFHLSFGKSFSDKWQKKLVFDEMTTNKIVTPMIVVIALFALYFFNTKPYLTGTTLIGALQERVVEQKFVLFEKALSYNSLGGAEIREQLSQTALGVGASQAPVEWKQKYFDLARSELLKQIEVPKIGDARYELFLGSYLTRFQRYDEALIHLKKAQELSPKKQIIMFEIGLVYISNKKYDQALEVFRQAYELEKNYPDARDYYAVAAIYAGQDNLVKSILEPVYGTTIVDGDNFVKAYADTNQYQKVLAIWQLRVEQNPVAKNYIGLGATYLNLGQRTKSIEAIQKAIDLDASFKDQGEYYIKEIRAGRNP
ncbi:MAG: O-antigen ligase family protein [Candidatus Paceibacterota bacterium]|jgi:O-antigen ligase